MSRLIDVDELIPNVKIVADCDFNDERRRTFKMFLDMLTNAPTVTADDYNKGLEDAWELAKKLYEMKSKEFDEAFGNVHYADVFYYYTPQETLAKLEAYEKEKELKVGDVVEEICTGRHFLIITEEEYGMYNFGVIDLNKMRIDRICNDTQYFKKTSRHLDINSFIEQLRGWE